MQNITNTNKNTLALCIPAYNAANYLPRILESAKNQLIPFDEILVYDDCSTDNTAEVAMSFGAKVINGDINKGCTWGRKILADNVKSTWIHFHDADDDMDITFTTLAQKWMKMPNPPDVVLFNYNWVNAENGNLIGKTIFDKKKAEENALLFSIETQINPFCGLYNTLKFIESGGPDLDPLVANYEDAAMHIKLAKEGLTFSVESNFCIINYCNPNSMSRNVNGYLNNISSVYFTMNKIYDQLKNLDFDNDEIKDAIGKKMWKHARHAAWVSQWEMLRKCIKLAKDCGVKVPIEDSIKFQLISRISPFYSILLREFWNRIFRENGKYWY